MRRAVALSLAVAAIVTLPGCLFLGEPADIRRDVTRSWDLTLEKEVGIELGRISTAITRALTRDEVDNPLEGIRKVEVGVYRVLDDRTNGERRPPLRLEGWETLVHARDGDGNETWVLYRLRYGSITGLVVVSLDDDELVLTRIRGSLQTWVEAVLRESVEGGREGAKRATPGAPA